MILTKLYARPYLLLALTAMFWGGNTVAGRLAIDHISPYQLVLLRWVAVVFILAFLLRGRLKSSWRQIRARARWVFAMGTAGFTCFNTLFYLAAHQTTAINLGIIQGTVPVWILIGAFAIYRNRRPALQIGGVLITVLGVVVLTLRGDLLSPNIGDINGGDLMMLAACFIYACYAVGLKNRPPLDDMAFLFFMAMAALISSLPLAVYEFVQAQAQPQVPDLHGWLVLIYVAIFPSLLSQIFFIRGVQLIGPERAGAFVNLVPVFAAMFAVLFIGESLHWFQIAALALVLGGIWLSEKGGKRGI